MTNSRWNPVTRNISYEKEKVATRLRYWAKKYRNRARPSDKRYELSLEDLANRVELGVDSPSTGAIDCILAAEEFGEEDYDY